jgi:hypothetical protein
MYEARAKEINQAKDDIPGLEGWIRAQWDGEIPDGAMLHRRACDLWDKVVHKYPGIWYDDNAGFYLIVVEVTKAG